MEELNYELEEMIRARQFRHCAEIQDLLDGLSCGDSDAFAMVNRDRKARLVAAADATAISVSGALDPTYPSLMLPSVLTEDDSSPNEGVARGSVAAAGFHEIDSAWPGLQLISRGPDVFLVHDFLSPSECDAVALLAGGNMARAAGGDANARTSTAARVEKASVPAAVARLAALLRCDARQLECPSVLRYTAGQFFKTHPDVWQHGRWSSSGFTDSTRLATLFVYLNDVAAGGATRFSRRRCPATGLAVPAVPPLDIRPKKGMAVVHFPASVDVESGAFVHGWPLTAHESLPAVDEKWIFATWMWADFEDPEPDLLEPIGS